MLRFRAMRRFTLLTAVFFLAGATQGDVRLTDRNGRKVIYNVGRSAGSPDLNWLAKRHDRRSKYDPYIEHYATKYGIDATLVRAVIQVESDFVATRVSHKGARGLMQLMPATAKRFGVTKIHDPEQNIRGGVQYLAYLTRLFNGDLPRVLAGYNAGENAVLRYGGIPPYEETSTYVVKAMTVYRGRPYGTAVSFAGARKGGRKLIGGFGAGTVEPLAAALIPGAKVLGVR
jgi:soluble lytic murein transglycosylase-like protein